MPVRQVVNWGISDPKRIFLIDGIGAICSAFFLGVVLVRLENLFGIPQHTLYLLASLPCLFTLYDLICFFRVKIKYALFIKGIALANILYCLLSVGFAIYHREVITQYGWIYISIEILLICVLVYFELLVVKRLNININQS